MGESIISVRKLLDAEESFDVSVDVTGWGITTDASPLSC